MNQSTLRKMAFSKTITEIMHNSAIKGVCLNNTEIIKIAMNHEAPSYFVTLAQAEKNINEYLSCGKFTNSTTEHRKKLWLSILSKLMSCGGIQNGTVLRPKLSYVLANCKAPSYFISENYARKLFYDKTLEL
ncbi:MAG: hypothetical protein K2H44_01175 [Muribaculaceae bacterium]|nr:hypothetical protein [Muribaculaceae bacterium]MDE5843984.1 hypothetical protein [Muribaculaceae bacterium]